MRMLIRIHEYVEMFSGAAGSLDQAGLVYTANTTFRQM